MNKQKDMNSKQDNVQKEILKLPPKLRGDLSDGYHSYNEIYNLRMIYNAFLFNEWSKSWRINNFIEPAFDVHKSWKHNDGELCFGGGWFIVVANLPDGQITNHYREEYWDLFLIPETETAKYPFDGHNSEDVYNRLKSLIKYDKSQ